MGTDNSQAELAKVLLDGNPAVAIAWAQKRIEQGVGPVELFKDILTPTMASIGDMFSRLEVFLPELINAADTAQAISNQVIQPRLRELKMEALEKQGKVVLGTVKGDLHDIGKNMVAIMLEVNGFEVIDMGVNVDTHIFLDRALETRADIVGLSALLTTSMPYMREFVEMRNGLGHKDQFAVIVGGAPITEAYCANIGAEAFGENAMEAVQKCLGLMKQRRAADSVPAKE